MKAPCDTLTEKTCLIKSLGGWGGYYRPVAPGLYCLPDNYPDFDELDSESGSSGERLDLDNLDLNAQKLNNGPRTRLVQWGVTTQYGWAVALTPIL